MNLETAVEVAIVFSGIFLWVGMLIGVWKYSQIYKLKDNKANYYVDIAHRSSLLYAPATLILAVLAYFSIWSEDINLVLVVTNLVLFSFSILSYVVYGMLADTNNQFEKPHKLGSFNISSRVMLLMMVILIIGELLSTFLLLVGTIFNFI